MDLILFLGLVALFFVQARQASRMARIEQELRALSAAAVREAGEPAASARQETPAPALPPREMEAWVGKAPAPANVAPEPPPPEPEEAEVRPASVRESPETMAAMFERLVGGRMLIWVGGIAFALGGVFLVRYSIGRITPAGRMLLAALLGLLLVAGGEFARGRPSGKVDPRVAQALVGAGILILYAAPYGALILYGLISSATAFALMAVVTAVALVLSLRHGAPSAILGLAGGFATPALVGDATDSAVPLLTYIALLDIALFVIAWRRNWTWLAAAAVALSFVWTAVLLASPPDFALAGGVFIVALGIAASLVRPGDGWQLPFLRPAGIGLFQLAILVARTDLGLPAWYLFGTLSLASFVLAGRRPEYRPLPAFALILALVLLASKAFDSGDTLAPKVGIAITLLFAAGALPGALRGGDRLLSLLVASAAFAAPAIILRAARPELLERPAWGGLMAALALGPILLAWTRRGAADPQKVEPGLAFAAACAFGLLGLAAWDLAPADLIPAAWLAIAAAGAFAARALRDRGLAILTLLGTAFAALWAIGSTPLLWQTVLASLSGFPALVTRLETPLEALQLLILPAAALFLIWHWLDEAWVVARRSLLIAAGIFLVGALYIFVKQVFALSDGQDFVAFGFAERLMITQALFLAGWLLGGGRIRLPWLDPERVRTIGTVLTALAAARLLWFDMIGHNPALVDQNVGALPVLNLLLPAFLLSAVWLYAARRRATAEWLSGVWLAGFLAALIVGIALLVRQLFHGAILTGPDMFNSEYYSYSLAGLLLAIALMLSGIRLPDKALRIAGLALLTAMAFKIFIADVRELEDIWRILSLLGLGAVGVGIGKLYGAVLRAEAKPAEG
jgi:uncharacterized membrane protein